MKRRSVYGILSDSVVCAAGYPDAENFSWERYLEETSSLPAPARAFKAVREQSCVCVFECTSVFVCVEMSAQVSCIHTVRVFVHSVMSSCVPAEASAQSPGEHETGGGGREEPCDGQSGYSGGSRRAQSEGT